MVEEQFTNNNEPPDAVRIKEILKDKYLVLEAIRKFIHENIGETVEDWKYYGEKNGWVLKTYLKKRNLFFIGIYDDYFRIAFVFGDKTFKLIMESPVSIKTKKTLNEAKKYAEGRAIHFEVRDDQDLEDIETLIRIQAIK